MKTAPELVELLRFFLTSQSGRHCQALLTVTPFLFDKKVIHPCDWVPESPSPGRAGRCFFPVGITRILPPWQHRACLLSAEWVEPGLFVSDDVAVTRLSVCFCYPFYSSVFILFSLNCFFTWQIKKAD
ncbi:hypothetical protein QVM86_11090 [Providencia stuartii]|nr:MULTISPECIES: hypothetical protein [Providencia]MDI7244915.1 hypothetical protein [Providencia rettgeri]MDN0019700.1 hypothetical protein [Providencia stuartii]